MSDDFEDSTNIFNASAGDLSADGNQVYATGLERFGNVFVPVKATAKAELSEAKSLTSKDNSDLHSICSQVGSRTVRKIHSLLKTQTATRL